MGQTFKEIPPNLIEWIKKQKVFFVATAPLAADGHVNVSPKGYTTLAVLSPTQVAYIDLTGSGIETLSHVNENGRITLMFASFEPGLPRIVRLFGKGRAIEKGHEKDYGFWRERMGLRLDDDVMEASVRCIVVVDVYEASTSCGYGVPVMEFKEERATYNEKISLKPRDYWPEKYQDEKNAVSKDGLPGIRRGNGSKTRQCIWKRASDAVQLWLCDGRFIVGLATGLSLMYIRHTRTRISY